MIAIEAWRKDRLKVVGVTSENLGMKTTVLKRQRGHRSTNKTLFCFLTITNQVRVRKNMAQ